MSKSKKSKNEGVVLNDPRETKTIELPSFKNSEIVIYDSLKGAEVDKLEKKDLENFSTGIETMIHYIKEWNFTNEEGDKLEISKENLLELPDKDIRYLMDEIGNFTELGENL